MVQCKTFAMMAASLWWAGDGRPEATYNVDNADGTVRCHYSQEAQLSRCNKALALWDEIWAVQVDQWGWVPPIADRGAGGSAAYDIYISADADGGAYVNSNYEDVDEGDDRISGSSYMVLAPTIPADELHLYMAHEFNHMLQFATDMSEPTLPVWEAAATWAEEVTYPGEGSSADVAPDFQRTPWLSLLGDSNTLWADHDVWSLYEYGAVLWLDHLREEYGVDSLTLWEAMINPTWKNEPDVLDAYDQLTGGWQAALLDLSITRARIGTDLAPAWAQELYPNARVRTAGALGVDAPELTPDPLPYDLGVVYVEVDVAEPTWLVVDGDPDVSWAVVLVEDGVVAEGPVLLEGPQTVGVVNLGPADFDGDKTPAQRALTLRLEPVEAEDSGQLPPDPEDKDRGGRCAVAPGAGGWALGALALALRSRRRA